MVLCLGWSYNDPCTSSCLIGGRVFVSQLARPQKPSLQDLYPPFFHTIPWLQSQTSIKCGMVVSLELSKQDLDILDMFHLYIRGRGVHPPPQHVDNVDTAREHETASPDSSVALALAGRAKATPSSFDGWGCGAWGQVEETLLGAVLVVLLCPKKSWNPLGLFFFKITDSTRYRRCHSFSFPKNFQKIPEVLSGM